MAGVTGELEIDLSTDRAVEDDFQRFDLRAVRHVSFIAVPDECYFHFGSRQDKAVDLRDFEGGSISVDEDEPGGIGDVFLENPTGASGTLELFVSTRLVAEVPGDTTIAGTVDVSDRDGRILGRTKVLDSGGSVIDPATDALEAALKSNDTDEIVARVTDDTGAEVDPRGFGNQSGLAYGQKAITTSGTAEAISGTQAVPDGFAVSVEALEGNTGNVYVGDLNVTTSNGRELPPGASVSLSVDDVATIFADVATDGDGVSWIVEVP